MFAESSKAFIFQKFAVKLCFGLSLHIFQHGSSLFSENVCDSWCMHQNGFSSAAIVPQSKFTELCSSASVVSQSKSTELYTSAAVVPQSSETPVKQSVPFKRPTRTLANVSSDYKHLTPNHTICFENVLIMIHRLDRGFAVRNPYVQNMP